MSSDLAVQIDNRLPQTQCQQCGYPRCRDYADAVARGEADINQCPPGGDVTLHALASLLHVPLKPLNPANGQHEARKLALIDEDICIGCRKCIDACPVDAIVGATKLMHTVIAAECTGCGLCLPPCPVDCIAMIDVTPTCGETWPEYTDAEAAHWRNRTEQRLARLERAAQQKTAQAAARAARKSVFPDRAAIRSDLQAALERARRKRQNGRS